MTAKEAYMKALKFAPKSKAAKCTEYNTLFVFHMVPVNFDKSQSADKILGGLVSVNKETGETQTFQPFHIPVEDYKNGKPASLAF